MAVARAESDVTVREAIDDAAARIDTELSDEPEVRADLHYTVGEVYRTHGESEIALTHFRQSLDLYRQVHGEQHPKVARGIYYLCVGMSRMGAGIEEVEPLLRQAIADDAPDRPRKRQFALHAANVGRLDRGGRTTAQERKPPGGSRKPDAGSENFIHTSLRREPRRHDFRRQTVWQGSRSCGAMWLGRKV